MVRNMVNDPLKYEGDVHALSGHVVPQSSNGYGKVIINEVASAFHTSTSL